MSYGVTATGFIRKTYAVILEEILDGIEADISLEMRQAAEDADTAINKLVCIVAEREADLWELAESVYNAMYPDSADGASLENTATLTGTVKLPATRSTVTGILKGTVGTAIADASKVATTTQGDQFETTAAITLASSVCSHAYIDIAALATGAYTVTINSTPFTYAATVPPDDENAILNTNLAALITAGAEPVSAAYTGGQLVVTGDADSEGLPTPFTLAVTANLSIVEVANRQAMEAVSTGPVYALAGTLTNIITTTPGWTSCTNPLAATLGRNVETDAELRERRSESLANPGSGTVDALRAAVLEVANVTACFVLENTSDAVDGNGLPAHSFRVMVLGGTTAALVQAIWDHKPAGIYPDGTTVSSIVDDQGFVQPVRFSRPSSVLMWIRLTPTEDTEAAIHYPDNGDAQVAAAALAWGQAETIGHDVLPLQCMAAVVAAVPGIRTLVVEVALDVMGAPGAYQTTPYTIAATELAAFDAARITVV